MGFETLKCDMVLQRTDVSFELPDDDSEGALSLSNELTFSSLYCAMLLQSTLGSLPEILLVDEESEDWAFNLWSACTTEPRCANAITARELAVEESVKFRALS